MGPGCCRRRPMRVLGVMTLLPAVSNCFCPHRGDSLTVRGILVEMDTGSPHSAVVVGGRTLTDGEVTDFVPRLSQFDTNLPPTDESGMFELQFFVFVGPPPGRCDLPGLPDEFPPPDQIEVIVYRECEQSFLFEVNATNFIDPSHPDVLELREPIEVPPCPEGATQIP